jgi:hypothetical protein
MHALASPLIYLTHWPCLPRWPDSSLEAYLLEIPQIQRTPEDRQNVRHILHAVLSRWNHSPIP